MAGAALRESGYCVTPVLQCPASSASLMCHYLNLSPDPARVDPIRPDWNRQPVGQVLRQGFFQLSYLLLEYTIMWRVCWVRLWVREWVREWVCVWGGEIKFLMPRHADDIAAHHYTVRLGPWFVTMRGYITTSDSSQQHRHQEQFSWGSSSLYKRLYIYIVFFIFFILPMSLYIIYSII